MVQPGDRLKFIEGLRGVAIGVVLVFHAAIWAGVSGQPAELLYFGHAGVDLFFVISGFCMLWPQLDNGSLRPLNPGRFYLRRALRIGPPYVVAVVAAVGASALMWKFGGPSWWGGQPMQSVFPTSSGRFVGNLATHLTFTHGFFPAYDRSIDGAFWSLATEFQFYLLLPLLVFVARRWGVPTMLAATAVVPAAYVLGIRVIDRGFIGTLVGSDLIFFRLVEFGAGMLAAWLISTNRRVPFIRVLVPVGLLAGALIDYNGPPPFLASDGRLGSEPWCSVAASLSVCGGRQSGTRCDAWGMCLSVHI